MKSEKEKGSFFDIFTDFANMPKAMKQLGLVQFFSWFALFSMWVFTTPAVAQHIYNLPVTDTKSDDYANASNWVGVLFSVYNGVSAVYALCLPYISKRIGLKKTHAFSLITGGLGLLSIFIFKDPKLLIISMIGVGFAWGSILAMPYAILSGSLPAKKWGYIWAFLIFHYFSTNSKWLFWWIYCKTFIQWTGNLCYCNCGSLYVIRSSQCFESE